MATTIELIAPAPARQCGTLCIASEQCSFLLVQEADVNCELRYRDLFTSAGLHRGAAHQPDAVEQESQVPNFERRFLTVEANIGKRAKP